MKPVDPVKPFNFLFLLCKAYEREVSYMIEAGIRIPCETPTDWNTKAFPAIKGNGVDVRLVGNFRGLNAMIQKLLLHTEFSDQILRHIPTDTKVFCVINVTSDKEASKLLTIVTNLEHFSFTVMPQVMCNSSALWNILTDGNSRKDSELNFISKLWMILYYTAMMRPNWRRS